MNRKSVAAAWANKTQENARIPSGNFYFTGPTLYSYGPHYVCAHHLPEVYNRAGRQIALINSADYSVTTTRHVHIARCALPDSVIRIEVPGLNADNVYDIRKHGCRDIVNLLLLRMGQLEAKAANPRIRSSTRAALLDEIDHADRKSVV